MSVQGTIKRYSLIISKVDSRQFPSFEELHAHLQEHSFDISARTLQRDMETIRTDFGLYLRYNKDRNGYYIDDDQSVNYSSFIRLTELVSTADIIVENLKAGKAALSNIAFEAQGTLRGVQLLEPLLLAIKERRKVSFQHENFQSGKLKAHSVAPYLLKEYQGRWYLVGLPEGSDDFRSFGLDRISALNTKHGSFERKEEMDPRTLFENTIGLTYSAGEIERVLLSFTAHQGKYVQTLPFHSSQEVLVDNDEEFRIALTVVPNYELIQKILMLGNKVRVMEPQWLKEQLQKVLQAALSNYDTL